MNHFRHKFFSMAKSSFLLIFFLSIFCSAAFSQGSEIKLQSTNPVDVLQFETVFSNAAVFKETDKIKGIAVEIRCNCCAQPSQGSELIYSCPQLPPSCGKSRCFYDTLGNLIANTEIVTVYPGVHMQIIDDPGSYSRYSGDPQWIIVDYSSAEIMGKVGIRMEGSVAILTVSNYNNLPLTLSNIGFVELMRAKTYSLEETTIPAQTEQVYEISLPDLSKSVICTFMVKSFAYEGRKVVGEVQMKFYNE